MTKLLTILFAVLIALSVVATFWKPGDVSGGRIPLTWVSDNNPARTEQIAAFNAENPDLYLQLDFGNTGTQKIILQAASGVGPDIFDFGNDQMEPYVEAGILWDVTEAAKAMNFYGGKVGWPSGVGTYTYEGKQYGFPCNTGTQTLIFNKNVFEHFGIPCPDKILTWEEFFALAQKVNSLTNPEGAKGKKIYAITGLEWRQFFESAHGEFFDERGALNILENAALRRAFDLHRDVIFTYRIAPTTVEAKQMSGQGGWGSGNLIQFASGRYAMILSGHWSLIAFGRAHEQQVAWLKEKGIDPASISEPLERPLRLGATPFPHFPGQPPCYQITSRVAGINARSPRREEALKFLQYLAGPTYARLLNQSADYLPGNPEYANLGIEPGPPDLARVQLQATTEEAMNYGYVMRTSPFLFLSDVYRVVRSQISRLESNPDLSTDEMLRAANDELRTLMRRNLERNTTLRDLFISRFGREAYNAL